jgi:predicted nucleotidyltransferase
VLRLDSGRLCVIEWQQVKLLCNYLGGSISYGLSTPQSDRDERYLFLNTEIARIIGLEKHEHESKQSDSEDSFGWELRHFLNLLRRGNTMCLEMLYNDTWLLCTEEFKHIQSYRRCLIDSECLYKCLRGYCQSERAFVLGNRSGKLGGKRHGHIEKYGYSFKNAVQFLRLCLAGKVFFSEGHFPVNITSVDSSGLLRDVKCYPEKFTKDDVVKLMDEYEKMLEKAYESTTVKRKYNVDIANQLCYDLYMPLLRA